MRNLLICVMITSVLAGCATTDIAPSASLVGPARFAMASIAPMPDPTPGKSCAVDNAQVRNVAVARGRQAVTLQSWVRRVCKNGCDTSKGTKS